MPLIGGIKQAYAFGAGDLGRPGQKTVVSWKSPHGRALPDWKSRVLVMGIVNLTPDSFSDGGRWATPEAAAAGAAELVAQGADVLDLGAESTRPGAEPVEPRTEAGRLLPALRAIRARLPDTPISVDTRHLEVAEAALAAGADILNDIQGVAEADPSRPSLAGLAAATGAPWILMHSRPLGPDEAVWPTVAAACERAVDAALRAGVRREQLWLDPGFGFGKTPAQNLELAGRLSNLVRLGLPVLLGTSRKSTLGKVLGEPDPLRRGPADAACAAWGIAEGASMIRVHDVAAAAPVVRMAEALRAGRSWVERPPGCPTRIRT